MIYEIVNPSDAYTIEAERHEVAVVACLLLGCGHYAFKSVTDDHSQDVPLFLFGGSDEWCKKTFGCLLQVIVDRVLENQRAAVIACLESCLIGHSDDRAEFDQACVAIGDPVKIAEFRAYRHNARRSSINDIGKKAFGVAAKLREQT